MEVRGMKQLGNTAKHTTEIEHLIAPTQQTQQQQKNLYFPLPCHNAEALGFRLALESLRKDRRRRGWDTAEGRRYFRLLFRLIPGSGVAQYPAPISNSLRLGEFEVRRVLMKRSGTCFGAMLLTTLVLSIRPETSNNYCKECNSDSSWMSWGGNDIFSMSILKTENAKKS